MTKNYLEGAGGKYPFATFFVSQITTKAFLS